MEGRLITVTRPEINRLLLDLTEGKAEMNRRTRVISHFSQVQVQEMGSLLERLRISSLIQISRKVSMSHNNSTLSVVVLGLPSIHHSCIHPLLEVMEVITMVVEVLLR